MKQAKLFKTTAFAGVSVAVVPEGVRVAPLEAGEPTVDLQDVPLALDPLTAAAGGVAGTGKATSPSPNLAARRWIHAEDVLRIERLFEEIAVGRSQLRIDGAFPGAVELALGVKPRSGVERAFREKILRSIAYLLATPTGRGVVEAVVDLATPTQICAALAIDQLPTKPLNLAPKAVNGMQFDARECLRIMETLPLAFADVQENELTKAKSIQEHKIRRDFAIKFTNATKLGARSETDRANCAQLLLDLKPLVDYLAALRKSALTSPPKPPKPKDRPTSIYLMPAWTNSLFLSRSSTNRPPPPPCSYSKTGVSEWADRGYTPFFLTLAHELIHAVHSERPLVNWRLLEQLQAALGAFNPAQLDTAATAALAVASALGEAEVVDEVWTSDEELATILGPGLTEAMLRCENGLPQRFGHGSWITNVPAGTSLQITPERLLQLFRNFGPNDVVGDYCGVAAPELIARLARR